jgi:hypothetical protein
MYFIKDAKMQYEKLNQEDIDNNTLQSITSITNCESNELFYLGYLHGLRQIIEKNRKYKMILMEENYKQEMKLLYIIFKLIKKLST